MIDLYEYEDNLYDLGYNYICGVDEAGRGPLAGPLVVASVILPKYCRIDGVNDSKKLTAKKRLSLYNVIMEKAISVKTTYIFPEEIDLINIYQATKKGMYEVIYNSDFKPDYVLIDAMKLEDLEIEHQSIIKGDAKSASIASASIIAKVTRDNYMINIANEYPNYEFEINKGYPTKKHLELLNKFGPCEIHRNSYMPVKKSRIKQITINLKDLNN